MQIDIKHPPLAKCQSNDSQCDMLNERLKSRQIIMSGEPYVNNIFVHYFVGFIIIYSLIIAKIQWIVSSKTIIMLILGMLSGWFLADILSYAMHFTIDSVFWKDNITKRDSDGYAVVDGHHDFTLNYSYMNNVELVSLSYPLVIPMLIMFSILHFYLYPNLLTSSPFYITLFTSFCICGLISGHSHKWAHERTHNLVNNKVIMKLQDMNILLNNDNHRKHHDEDDNMKRYNYSLSNGSAERVIDPLLQQCRDHNICKF